MNNKRVKTSLNIASVQMHMTQSQDENLKTMEQYLQHIQKTFPQIDMVVYPELCAMNIGKEMKKDAQEIPGPLTDIFSSWAKQYNLWIIPGSMYELSDQNSDYYWFNNIHNLSLNETENAYNMIIAMDHYVISYSLIIL